jgi:hypothetical protein
MAKTKTQVEGEEFELEEGTEAQPAPEASGEEEGEKEPKIPYWKTEKGKVAHKTWAQSEKGQAKMKEYRQSEKYKDMRKKYQESDKGKEARKRYQERRKLLLQAAKQAQAEGKLEVPEPEPVAAEA